MLEPKKLLNGRRVVLRGLVDADRAQLLKWRNDPDLKRLTGPGPFVPVRTEDIQISDSEQSIQFGICLASSQQLVGVIALSNLSWTNRCAELSIFIGETANHGVSYGTDAIRMLLDYGFNELNLHRIELEVVSYNARAIRAYRNLGFTLEGTKREFGERDGQRYDLQIYGLLADEHRTVR